MITKLFKSDQICFLNEQFLVRLPLYHAIKGCEPIEQTAIINYYSLSVDETTANCCPRILML